MGTISSSTPWPRSVTLLSRPTPLWLWPNLLSLDAPAVALVWQDWFARQSHTPLSWVTRALLGLTVWLVYVGDRCWDARAQAPEQSARHLFYYRLHRPMCMAAGIGTLCIMALLTQASSPIVWRGVWVGAGTVAYLAVVHVLPGVGRRWWPKKAVAGVLFSLGTCLAAWPRLDERLVLLFAALCWLNCVTIEAGESRAGITGGQPHPMTRWAARHLRWLALIAVIAAVWLDSPPCAWSAMALLLLGEAGELVPAELLPVLADASLLTPVFWWPLLHR